MCLSHPGLEDPSLSTFDHVIVQSELEIEKMWYRPALGESNHCILSIEFIIKDDLPDGTQLKREREEMELLES